MATIGGVTCSIINGSIGPKSQRTDVFEMPGVDGYGAQKLGLGDSEFELGLVLFGTQVALSAWQVLIKALVGSVVTIVDSRGVTTTGCLIKDVTNMDISAAAWAAGTVDDRRGEMRLKGVVT